MATHVTTSRALLSEGNVAALRSTGVTGITVMDTTATRDEAKAVTLLDTELFLSCNRTCELGLTRATGQKYVHVLEELAARVEQAQLGKAQLL